MRIKDISAENRPRERLENLGPKSLSDAELLAIVLGSGTKGSSAIDVANLILKDGLSSLRDYSLEELKAVKGLGLTRASRLKAVMELGRRMSSALPERKSVLGPKSIAEYLGPEMLELGKEHFICMNLDSRGRMINKETIAVGSLNEAVIHPREVFKSAVKASANSVILVHNHPSGNPEPSKEDTEVTKVFRECGDIMDIKVLDHVILGRGNYFSFREEGLI